MQLKKQAFKTGSRRRSPFFSRCCQPDIRFPGRSFFDCWRNFNRFKFNSLASIYCPKVFTTSLAGNRHRSQLTTHSTAWFSYPTEEAVLSMKKSLFKATITLFIRHLWGATIPSTSLCKIQECVHPLIKHTILSYILPLNSPIEGERFSPSNQPLIL